MKAVQCLRSIQISLAFKVHITVSQIPKAAKEETKSRSYLPRSTGDYPNIRETPNCKDIKQTYEDDVKHTCKKIYISDASTTIQSHETETTTRPAIPHRSVSASVSSTSEDEALLGVTLNVRMKMNLM